MAAIRVLLICTGNICRSPMAVALLRHAAADLGLTDWTVESAGTGAVEGLPASAPAQMALREIGLDLSQHRARQLTPAMLEQADLVLTMTPSHRDWAIRLAPQAAHKIHLLDDRSEHGVPDPYGQSIDVYRSARDRIREALARWLDRLRDGARKEDPEA